MKSITINSGPAEIVASGTVIAFSEHPIIIKLANLNAIFKFRDEKEKDDQHIEKKLLDPTTLELTLYNFDNPIGSGTSKPMLLGQLNGQPLYVHFRVYALHGSDKTLQFAFYRVREGKGNA